NAFVLVCSLLSIFFVSDSCHQIYFESAKIGCLLYDDNYLALAEGQHFLSQIVNQPIKITAKEFYKLDRSFFATLTVGSITAAIMLVQFQVESA
ncbi:hypothetical protein Bhyg_17641, partial [Pseudolycoriella hygida]